MTDKLPPLPEAVRRQVIACHCTALCRWLESLATDRQPQTKAPKPVDVRRARRDAAA